MKYAALMFDIVESRHYQRRYDVQHILMSAVNYLNYLFQKDIKKEVVSSAGDEFQGLFFDLQSAFLYIRKLQMIVYPVKLRCGIGYGEIKYDVDDWSSSAFDGEAYYLARDAILELSKKKNNAIIFNTKSNYDKYLNMLCFSSIDMKARQSQVARWIELLSDIILPIKRAYEDISFYHFVLDMRYRMIESETWNRVYGRPREVEPIHTDFGLLFDTRENFEIKSDGVNRFMLEEFWVHGMSTLIAQAMDTSRQNVDRYVALGKIKESRTIDKTIYELLGENIWEHI